jgi:hypothetical protein
MEDVVFLFEVDNALLDNDQVQLGLVTQLPITGKRLETGIGRCLKSCERRWVCRLFRCPSALSPWGFFTIPRFCGSPTSS